MLQSKGISGISESNYKNACINRLCGNIAALMTTIMQSLLQQYYIDLLVPIPIIIIKIKQLAVKESFNN